MRGRFFEVGSGSAQRGITMEIVIAAGAILAAVSTIPYIIGVTKGDLKPKVVSWFTWSLLSVLLTGAAIAEGYTISAIMSSIAALSTGSVMILGLKHGNRSLDKLDILCLGGAMAGIAVWLLLDNPTLAIFVAVAVDIIAFIPSLVHGWKSPEEESLMGFALATVGAGLGFSAAVVSSGGTVGIVYPLYAVLFNGLMALLLARTYIQRFVYPLRPAIQEEEVIA